MPTKQKIYWMAHIADAKLQELFTMRQLGSFLLAGFLASQVAFPAQAQSSDNPREVYSEARAKMDKLIMERRMGDAIRTFEGFDTPNSNDLAAIDSNLQALYEGDFENVALVRSEVHKN